MFVSSNNEFLSPSSKWCLSFNFYLSTKIDISLIEYFSNSVKCVFNGISSKLFVLHSPYGIWGGPTGGDSFQFQLFLLLLVGEHPLLIDNNVGVIIRTRGKI